MAGTPSALQAGTVTPTGGTAWVIYDSTGTAGFYQVVVDANASALGDDHVIEVLEAAVPGGTQRLVERVHIVHVQAWPVRRSGVIAATRGVKVQVTNIAGTARALPWEVRGL